jgi:hypothetical protein
VLQWVKRFVSETKIWNKQTLMRLRTRGRDKVREDTQGERMATDTRGAFTQRQRIMQNDDPPPAEMFMDNEK